MSVTHSNAALSAATDAVTALIGSSGNLKFRLTGTVGSPGTAVATLPLSATAFPASPVATATLETSGGTVVIHCAVAASGSDINMSNGLTVANGDTVSCSSLTYKAIPS